MPPGKSPKKNVSLQNLNSKPRKSGKKSKEETPSLLPKKNSSTRSISIRSAKLRAWQAIAAYVRKRDPYCVTCGAQTTQAGHWQHNGDKPNKNLGGNLLWYDERNLHGQCSSCNLFKSGNLNTYSLFLERTYGSGILQELNRLYNTPKKWTIEEILEIEKKYK